jgi:hypothetical protein
MSKTYIRQCKVDLIYKSGQSKTVLMDLDLNDSVDDQICDRYDEAKLKNWWWFEVNGPSMNELKNILLTGTL